MQCTYFLMKSYVCICGCIMIGLTNAVLPGWLRFRENSDAWGPGINADYVQEEKTVFPYRHFVLKPAEEFIRHKDIVVPEDKILQSHIASDLAWKGLIPPEENDFIPTEDERFSNENLYNTFEMVHGVNGFIYPEQTVPIQATEYAYHDNVVAEDVDDLWHRNEHYEIPRLIIKEPVIGFRHPKIKLSIHKVMSGRPLRRSEYPNGKFDSTWDEVYDEENEPDLLPEFGIEDRSIDHPIKPRIKRAMPLIYDLGTALILKGLRATRKLLTGTKTVTEEGKVWQYEKKGTAYEAFKDFMNVEPSDIHNFQTRTGAIGKAGRVGDRQIKVYSRYADGNPAIEITKTTVPFDQGTRIVITYGKHFLPK